MERSFKRLEGTLPKKAEIGEWSEPRIRAFFEFAQFFMKQSAEKGWVYDVSDESIAAAWEVNQEYWLEFLHRLTPKKQEELKVRRLNAFRTRLMNFIRTVGAWLKANPHAVSPEMEALMRANPRFSWALDTFVHETSGIGELMVMPNGAMESADPAQGNHNPTLTNRSLPEVQYYNSLAKLTSLMNELVMSIDRSQMKGLPTKDKLKLALVMADTLGKTMRGQAPAKSIFNTLILQKGGREDLEKSLIAYAEEQ